MLCPSCGMPEQEGQVVCPRCHAELDARTLLAVNNLEFLLAEMDGWAGLLPGGLLGSLRERYAEQLHDARSGLKSAPTLAGRQTGSSVRRRRTADQVGDVKAQDSA